MALETPFGASIPEPGFFDDYPRFYETGNTRVAARLNARYECLIERHKQFIDGKTIVDIGSHDGRWGFAALKNGAQHVTGIEPNVDLVEGAVRNFAEYNIPEDSFAFHAIDARGAFEENVIRVDTVFLFGVFYHVHYHVDLMRAIRDTEADTVIIDTRLGPDVIEDGMYRNTISFHPEQVDDINANKNQIYPGAGQAISGQPSRSAVQFLFEMFGFTIMEIPWGPYLARWGSDGLRDYASGIRGTLLAQRQR